MNKIYIINANQLNNEDVFYKYYQKMSDFRKEKINRHKISTDKNRSLAAGILIDNFLKSIGLSEKNIAFEFSKNGKPYFKEPQNIFFNLSHSGDYAICVFSDKEIGCDLENINKGHINIAKRVLTQRELEKLNSFKSGKEKEEIFFRFWTLKESYIKYLGTGLSKSLTSFEIDFDKFDKPFLVFSEQSPSLFFKEISYNNYKIAICTENKNFSTNLNHIEL